MNEQITEKQTLDESFINYLESVLKRDDRAVLANLRRGLGKEAGTAMEMFPYVARFIQSSNRREEIAFLLVASLFGLYPTYSWKTEGKGRNNLGNSISLLNDESGSIEKRFVALLNADEEDLPNHLRQIVSLLKANDKPINWKELLRGIKQWNRSDRKIQREWAKGFWGNTKIENKGEEKQ